MRENERLQSVIKPLFLHTLASVSTSAGAEGYARAHYYDWEGRAQEAGNAEAHAQQVSTVPRSNDQRVNTEAQKKDASES